MQLLVVVTGKVSEISGFIKNSAPQFIWMYFRGSTIAKIVGNNVQSNPKFETNVNMYVYEEMVNDRKLTEIINTDHENVKYLPGHKLPTNIVSRLFRWNLNKLILKKFFFVKIAIPDVTQAAEGADVLIFVLPHQFMTNTCKPLVGKIKPTAFGVSLCKVIWILED